MERKESLRLLWLKICISFFFAFFLEKKSHRWTQLPVSALPQKFPMTVLPTVTCQDAIEILRREGFDQMPVVDASG